MSQPESSNQSSDTSGGWDYASHNDSPHSELSKVISEHEYPPTSKVVAIIGGLFLVLFLVSLDRLIVGVAIPSITNEFHSLEDVGW